MPQAPPIIIISVCWYMEGRAIVIYGEYLLDTSRIVCNHLYLSVQNFVRCLSSATKLHVYPGMNTNLHPEQSEVDGVSLYM